MTEELINKIATINCNDEERKDIYLTCRKQIPKKIKLEQWIYTKCECSYEFSVGGFDGYYRVPHVNRTNYCPDCGQRLSWEE